jgi:hypothetical protein
LQEKLFAVHWFPESDLTCALPLPVFCCLSQTLLQQKLPNLEQWNNLSVRFRMCLLPGMWHREYALTSQQELLLPHNTIMMLPQSLYGLQRPSCDRDIIQGKKILATTAHQLRFFVI